MSAINLKGFSIAKTVTLFFELEEGLITDLDAAVGLVAQAEGASDKAAMLAQVNTLAYAINQGLAANPSDEQTQQAAQIIGKLQLAVS